MCKEIWKDIDGFEYYQVSNLGRVRSIKFKNHRYLRQNADKSKYVLITFFIDGKRHYKYLHRLVAQAFIPNPENKPQVNHKNGIKSDNYVENLEWNTSKENINHAISNKLRIGRRGYLNNWVKLTESQVIEIRKTYKKGVVTHKQLSDKFDVTDECVRKIVIGESWRHLL